MKRNNVSDYNIFFELLNELEIQTKNLNLRGFKGYGYGHPWSPRKRLGYGILNPADSEEKEKIIRKPVKISRAFK